MSETRMHDPDDDEGIGHLVREALGDVVRPVEPGGSKSADQEPTDEPVEEPAAAHLPDWGTDGPTLHF